MTQANKTYGPDDPITGRCYCGACRVCAAAPPLAVAYCHCSDCRRLTGAPVAAFAAFAPDGFDILPQWPEKASFAAGVDRWACPACGSALAATYDYLPGQVYVPIGILDQAADFAPQSHSHAGNALPWLHIHDDLPRNEASGRDLLNASKT